MFPVTVIFQASSPKDTDIFKYEIQCRLSLPGMPSQGDRIVIMGTELRVDHIVYEVTVRATTVFVWCQSVVTDTPNTLAMNWIQNYFNVTCGRLLKKAGSE